jgi:histone-lysine N-methyltransferase SETD1
MEKATANTAMPALNVSTNAMVPPPKNNLKVQTFMCGRLNIKDGTGEVQSETDMAIANGILRQRWIPFAILPPHTIDSPTPKSKLGHRPRDSRTDDPDDPNVEYASASNQAEVSKEAENPGDDASVSSRSKDESMDVDDDTTSTDAATQEARPTAKRLRSARIAAGTNSASQADSLGDDDRQELAIRYKEDADELHKRCLGVACCGILLALMRRDPLLLFASPVTAEGYSSIIKNPIDFGKIRRNVLEDQYGTLGSFVSDCRLLCTNALAYNPPGSIYWKTAKELYDVLAIMQRRVSDWMTAVKDAHAMAWRRARNSKIPAKETVNEDRPAWTPEILVEDPFAELRKTWPEAVEMLEDSDWLRRCISADFMRTRENETAYYGALAVRRTAAASEAALAAYPDSGGIYNPVARRTYLEDEALRRAIDDRVAKITHPVELKDLPSWREEAIIRVLRRAQNRRFDGLTGSNNGCARCDGSPSDPELKRSKPKQPSFLARHKRKNNEASRIDPSRIDLSTGMASQVTRARLQAIRAELSDEKDPHERAKAANEVAVSVQGSGIHGWGLFADQFFKKGDVVAEYIGEYVSLAVTEAREKMYQEQRIQDYQFRVDDQLVIDATMRGGHGRYINHNCNPNCVAKIIPGTPPNEHLKRVIIIAQRDIEPREELTYDYQFPLELDLEARIPCNCMSEHCRGFMNWDLPEKGSNTHVFRAQKRGANMRDRIRRLGRPLKSDKGDDVDDLD